MSTRWGTALLAALLLFGCRETDRNEREEEEPRHAEKERTGEEHIQLSSEAVEGAGIKVVPVGPQPLRQTIETTAVIKANEYRLAQVSPRITGKAVEVLAELGNLVREGQVLAYLDSIDLGERKAAYLQARTNLQEARRNHEREARLYREQVSSEKEYLEAKSDFARDESAYRAAREALRLIGLGDDEIDRLDWGSKHDRPSLFPLLAPFAGTVIERHVTIGELVNPDSKPFTIADLSTVWVLLAIFEKDLGRVGSGAAAELAVDAYAGEVFSGTVTYVNHVVDSATRTAEARVEIDNRDGRLRLGMFTTARITIPSSGDEAALVAPHSAIQQVHGQSVAFIEEKPGAYRMRALTLGRDSGSVVEIRSGLTAGERLVTDGAFFLKSILLKEEIGGEED